MEQEVFPATAATTISSRYLEAPNPEKYFEVLDCEPIILSMAYSVLLSILAVRK
jgi:hypothetical protein